MYWYYHDVIFVSGKIHDNFLIKFWYGFFGYVTDQCCTLERYLEKKKSRREIYWEQNTKINIEILKSIERQIERNY